MKKPQAYKVLPRLPVERISAESKDGVQTTYYKAKKVAHELFAADDASGQPRFGLIQKAPPPRPIPFHERLQSLREGIPLAEPQRKAPEQGRRYYAEGEENSEAPATITVGEKAALMEMLAHYPKPGGSKGPTSGF